MALPIYQLGNYQFITLHRVDDPSAPPEFVATQVRVIEREGVDGTGFIRTGRRGLAAQYRSICDFATQADAVETWYRYTEMIGQQRYGLVWHDIDYEFDFETQFVVTAVTMQSVKYLSSMAGGLSGMPAGWLLTAIWTLVPVPSV